MKNTGPLLIGITVAVAVGFAVYAYLDSLRDDAPQTEEEFLNDTRQAAETQAEPASAKGAKLPPATADGFSVPRIEVETVYCDLGIIQNDRMAEGSVKIFNRGTAPLEISNIKTTCHCTEGVMVNSVIPAGGEGTMKVTVDPFRIPLFTSHKTLTITSNDPKTPQVKVDVVAAVVPELSWDPKEIAFGEVAKGETHERTFFVREETAPFTLTSVGIAGSKLDSLKTSFEEVPPAERRDSTKTEYKVTVKTEGQLQADTYRGQVVLSFNGLKRVPRIVVPVSITVKATYKVEPGLITLRSVAPGELVQGVLKVMSEVPLEIEGFRSQNTNLTATIRPGETPNSYEFDLKVEPAVTERVQRDTWTFVVKTNGLTYEENIKVLAVLTQRIEPTTPQAPVTVPPAAPATPQ